MADNTWKFLEHQESNPEALKQAVDTLIGYTKKKGFAGAENAQLDSLELVKHVIICEAAALVLSDRTMDKITVYTDGSALSKDLCMV